MNTALHDSLFELYMQGGLELFQVGTRGLKRELIIQLEKVLSCIPWLGYE